MSRWKRDTLLFITFEDDDVDDVDDDVDDDEKANNPRFLIYENKRREMSTVRKTVEQEEKTLSASVINAFMQRLTFLVGKFTFWQAKIVVPADLLLLSQAAL